MKKLLLLLLFPILLFASGARNYPAKVLSIHDGDTMTVEIDLGLDLKKKEVIRLFGLDCQELSTPEGRKVAHYVHSIADGKEITIQTQDDKRDKYGRLLATIFIGPLNLNEDLIQKGFAKGYDGGSKKGLWPVKGN